MSSAEERVGAALAEARALGFLGPGPLERHLRSGYAFIEAAGEIEAGSLCADLGSGGGVPGLLLAAAFSDVRWVFLDTSQRRTAFLRRTIAGLGWGDRVAVRREEVQAAGRDPRLAGQCTVVTARSFASPAITAESAVPLLRPGGRLLVAEPPTTPPGRWSAAALAQVGLALEQVVEGEHGRIARLHLGGHVVAARRGRREMERHPLW